MATINDYYIKAIPNLSQYLSGSSDAHEAYVKIGDITALNPVNFLDYGAIGDGIADNTQALSIALNNPNDVEIPSGIYRISGTINVAAGSSKRIVGNEGVIFLIELANNIDFIVTYRALSFYNITFDFGNGNVRNGILYRPNCGEIVFQNVTFQNLKDIDITYGSIPLYINPSGNTFDLSDIHFSSMLKRGNGIITDSGGNLDCIYIGGTGDYAIGSIRRTTFNEIHNINASDEIIYEDTACIYIITPSTDLTYQIGIGSSSQIVTGTKIKNTILTFDDTVIQGLADINGNIGFDNFEIDGLTINYDNTATAIPIVFQYLNGTSIIGANFTVNNLTIISNGLTNSYGFYAKYINNVSLLNYRYRNISVNKHFGLAVFDTCLNVTVDDVVIEGSATIGVQLVNCTGKGFVNNVKATACDYAAYNNNSGDVMISNTDPAKVGGTITSIVNQHYSSGITSTRPNVNLIIGQQHYDTTLEKPIWWSGGIWKDANGSAV